MKDEMYKVPILTDLSESDKATTIDQFVRMTAKYTLQMFMMLGLKTHIEAKIVNEPTKEEFIFSFKKVETTPLPSSDNVKSAEENLKSILIDLDEGAIDKYAAYDLITTLFAHSHQVEMPGDEEVEKVFEYYHPAINEDEKKVCMKVVKWFKSQIKQ